MPATPGDFWIEGAEATQGVQLGQLVPLIAMKRTFVRVTVRGEPDSNGVLPTVRATLSVVGDPATYRPLNGDTRTVPRAEGGTTGTAFSLWTLADSFVYELAPAHVTAGSRTVEVSLTLADGSSPPPPPTGTTVGRSLRLNLRFGPTGDPIELHVYGVRIQYHNVPPEYQRRLGLLGPIWPAPDWAAFDRIKPLAENVLPIVSLTIHHYPGSANFPPDPIGDLDCLYDLSGSSCNARVVADWAAQLLDDVAPGSVLVVLQPGDGVRLSWFATAGSPTAEGGWVIGTDERIDAGLVLARRLALRFGLCYTDDHLDHCALDTYPRAGGELGPYTGLRYDPLAVVLGENPLGTSVAFDLMTQSGPTSNDVRTPAWFSPHNYCVAMANMSAGQLTCPGGLDHTIVAEPAGS